jgi:hypothetical protein
MVKAIIVSIVPLIIVYYVMRSKNEVLCAAAGRLAADCSEHVKKPGRNFK